MPEELPPLIQQLIGDAGDLYATLDDVEARLEAFASQDFTANININTDMAEVLARLETEISALQAEIEALNSEGISIPVSLDDADLIPSLAEAKALIDSLTKVPNLLSVQVDQGELVGSLAASKGLFQAFAAHQYNVEIHPEIGMNAPIAQMEALDATLSAMGVVPITPVISTDHIAEVMAQLGALSQPISPDIDPTISASAYALAKAELDTLAKPVVVPVDINESMLAAKLASIDATIASGKAALMVENIASEAFRAEAAGATAALASGGMKGITAAALMTSLGYGQGSITGIFSGINKMFSFGFLSLGSLAGFGPEHLLTTILGLGGSATGAGLGGLALMLSSLSTAAVGFGTDLAGIGQASGDIGNVSNAMNSLNAAVGTYGQNSTQAVAAQNTLNEALTSFNPIARNAVVAAAQGLGQLSGEFDAVTGQAEKMGAEIISSLEGVAAAYIPTIGKFATENTAIIQKDLAPLFAWLKNPLGGLGNFTLLEDEFQKTLPTALSALTQGLELFIKTMAFLAPETGHFIADLNNFFTDRNTASGFDKWTNQVQHMVDLFRVWDQFAVILVKDIADIFGASASLGSGIITELTGYLDQLHKALNDPGGNDLLKNLFLAHKDEVLQLIAVVVQLGESITRMYLIAAPALTNMATLVLQLISGFITLVSKIPGGATALGIALIAAKMGILTPFLFGAAQGATLLQKAFGWIGTATAGLLEDLAGLVFGMDAVKDASTLTRLAMVGLSTAGILGLAVGIYELIHDFGVLPGIMIAAGVAIAGVAGAFFLLSRAEAAMEAVDAVAAAEGIEEAFSGLAGAILAFGPEIIAVAAAVGVIAGALYLLRLNAEQTAAALNHIPTAASKAVNSISQMPATNFDQVTTKLADLNDELDKLEKAGPTSALDQRVATLTTGSALGGYTDAIARIKAEIASTNAVGGVLSTNFDELNKKFGLSASSAQDLANKLGINLSKALTTKDLDEFSGGLALQAAQAGVTAQAIAALSNTTGKSTEQISTDISNVATATQASFAAAGNILTNFAGATSVTGQDIQNFYTTATFGAASFSANISKAIKDGYSPALISQIIQSGPSQAGALLQGLVSSYSSSFLTMVNNSTNALSAISAQAVEQARLIQMAVEAPTSAMAADITTALAISQQLTAQGATATWASIASALKLGLPQVEAVAQEYGILLPNALATSVTPTGNAANGQVNAYLQAVYAAKNPIGAAGTSLSASLALAVASGNGPAKTAGATLGTAVATGVTSTSIGFNAAIKSVLGGASGPGSYLATTAVTEFTGLGKNLMAGLAAGILAGTSAVKTAAQNASIIAFNAAITHSQTSSPSKLYARMGRDWMAGLVQGIDSGAGAVQEAVTNALPHASINANLALGITGPASTAATAVANTQTQILATLKQKPPSAKMTGTLTVRIS